MSCTLPQPVLLTGATGFIGARLARRLIERGCQVFCLVRADSQAGSRIGELQSAGAELVIGDVTDRGSVERALVQSQAGVVFHLAGLVRAQRWGVGKDDFMRVNAGGVENVAATCADCAAPPILVVVSSLAAVGPSALDEFRIEGDLAAPISNYGRSKLAGEHAAARYAASLPITIVRPPVVFGPGDRATLELFRPIDRWNLHLVPGWRGRDRRLSLVHIDDLIEGLLFAAEKGERLHENATRGQGIYFITGEERPTLEQFGCAIAKALGRSPPTILRLPGPLLRLVGIGGDVIAHIRGRPGWINSDKMTEALAGGSWTCSAAKARLQLGWSPAATMSDRLHETVLWYRQAGWLGPDREETA